MDSAATERDVLEKKLHDPTAPPIFLPLQFLKDITCNFSIEQELGRGGYGVVYKGVLRSGKIIAVKKLFDMHLVEDDQFLKEVSNLMEIKHQNIVQLVGYCAESRWEVIKLPNGNHVMAQIPTRLLCFDYLCNRSLDNLISDESSGLDWNKRYEIIKGICSGLHFLHGECHIVHLDLKPENILMDATMMPKIADFGLSRLLGAQKSRTIIKEIAGSRGYMAPEYLLQGVVTPMADIFSFGVIMIEIITGRKDYPMSTVPYFQQFNKNGTHQSIEVSLQQFTENVLGRWRNMFKKEPKYTSPDIYTQQVKQCITIALKCVDHDSTTRPNAWDIFQMLNAVESTNWDAEHVKDSLVHEAQSQAPFVPVTSEEVSLAEPQSSEESKAVGQESQGLSARCRSDVAEQSGEVVSRSLAGSVISRENFGYAHARMDRHMVPRQMAAATTGPADWREALDIVALGLPEQSVEGMKVICHELCQAADPESTVLEELIKEADRLVSCLSVIVPKTFNFSLSGASSLSCKHVLNTIMRTFQTKRLAHAVKEGTLDNLITELLLWLLDERVPLMDDGSQLLKALNVLMLIILDNAERTSSFVVLINLLRPLDPSRWPSHTPLESLAVKNQKFSDLVVKCLIKLTKVLQSTIYEVDLDRILQSIHIYLQELGMEEIRRRAGADDKPLRMVKTVLHELVKLRGTAIKGHLSMVPIDAEPQPIILAYIDLNLQTLAAARMLTPSGPMGQTHWGDAASNSPNPSTHSADAQLKQELAAVFKKIGDKQTCTIGLYELYRITQLYPKVDIFAQLQNASEAFRTYIRDGLAQVEKNAVAGRTPSSLPLSTPPPIASIPSPKFAPSPVHTKSINSKTGSNEDEPFGVQGDSDSRLHSTDQQTERYQTSGTLDALRERMKSIQAAAVGHFDGTQARPLTSMNGNMLHGGTRLDGEPQQQSNIQPMDERALSGLQARMERLKSGSMEQL